MEIVIDIPDEIRKSIFDDVYCGIIDSLSVVTPLRKIFLNSKGVTFTSFNINSI